MAVQVGVGAVHAATDALVAYSLAHPRITWASAISQLVRAKKIDRAIALQMTLLFAEFGERRTRLADVLTALQTRGTR